MGTFFEELKIAAGGIIQLASAVFPAWELPNWTLRLTVVLLLIGFPLALVLAWAFDVTSNGIQATLTLSTANGAATTHLRCNVSFVDGIS